LNAEGVPTPHGTGRWQQGAIGNLLARAEESRMSGSTCIAYRDDGTLCRAPASILDHQRGGMVCLQHVPADVAEEITLYLKMGTVEGRIDNDGEVYSWRVEAEDLACEAPTKPAEDWAARALAVLQEVASYIGAGLFSHPLPELVEDLRARIAQLLQEAEAKGKEDPRC
jgi:hypothetical protein